MVAVFVLGLKLTALNNLLNISETSPFFNTQEQQYLWTVLTTSQLTENHVILILTNQIQLVVGFYSKLPFRHGIMRYGQLDVSSQHLASCRADGLLYRCSSVPAGRLRGTAALVSRWFGLRQTGSSWPIVYRTSRSADKNQRRTRIRALMLTNYGEHAFQVGTFLHTLP